MRVSVIVPNYNKEKVLGACLDAVYAQSSPPAEVIVVDDASTDASVPIARRYPCRLVEQPRNRGVSAARNAGAARATGDVLFFVDSDIALASDAIEQALRVLAEHPRCAVVQGIYDVRPLVDDGPVERFKVLYENFWRGRRDGVVTSTLFALTAVRRAVFDEVGGFDERLRDAEDLEWGTRLPARHEVRMSAAVVGRHDDVDRLGAYLAELFRRARTYAATRAPMIQLTGEDSALLCNAHRSAVGVGAAAVDRAAVARLVAGAGTVGGLPLGVLSPWLLLVPGTLAFVVVLLDRDLLRYAIRQRGVTFGAFVAAMQLLTHTTEFCGMSIGFLTAAVRGAPSRPLTGSRS